MIPYLALIAQAAKGFPETFPWMLFSLLLKGILYWLVIFSGLVVKYRLTQVQDPARPADAPCGRRGHLLYNLSLLAGS
jgi:uncharacterized membrane protein